MEAKNKETYQTPVALVVEVKTEGIVCGSPYGTQNYNFGGLDEED